MPIANWHAAHMRDIPEGKEAFTKEIADGINLIGYTDGDASVEASYRFAADKFTPEQAKAWMEEHGKEYTSFEDAIKEEPRENSPFMGQIRTLTTPLVSAVSKVEEMEDGGLMIKDQVLLSAGVWTDSAVQEPLEYTVSALQKYFDNWKYDSLYGRHYGGAPRKATDKVGRVMNRKFDGTRKAIVGDIYFHRKTQESKDTATLALSGLVPALSVEHTGEEMWNTEQNRWQSKTLKFLGCAVVEDGACADARFALEKPRELQDNEERDIALDEEIMQKFAEMQSQIDALKALAEAPAGEGADPTATKDEAVSKAEEALQKATDVEQKLEEVVAKVEGTEDKMVEMEKVISRRQMAAPTTEVKGVPDIPVRSRRGELTRDRA